LPFLWQFSALSLNTSFHLSWPLGGALNVRLFACGARCLLSGIPWGAPRVCFRGLLPPALPAYSYAASTAVIFGMPVALFWQFSALSLNTSFHSSWPSRLHFCAGLRFLSPRLLLLCAAMERSMFFVGLWCMLPSQWRSMGPQVCFRCYDLRDSG
jgi:hypothetical protein